MAPQIKKAKTAFLYYQGDKLASIKKELKLSMGEAMTEVRSFLRGLQWQSPYPSLVSPTRTPCCIVLLQLAARWRTLSESQREKYLELERQDRERFDKASVEADAVRLTEQEARRNAQFMQKGEDSKSRGARKSLDEERERITENRERRRQQREADMDDDDREERQRLKDAKRKETEERQRKRADEEAAVSKQHKKLDREQSKKTANRLEYLFQQSPIFAKLKMGKGSMAEAEKAEAEEAEAKKRDRSSRGRPEKPHHLHDNDSPEEDEDLIEEEETHIFLTKQPNCIKFGKLKPYQVESLNWMIHLAEKGLNGILADEVSLCRSTNHFFEYYHG
jgi:SWI/SNF-related matrix-associated actin-dependent regulator of chromatin subfamily A member 5